MILAQLKVLMKRIHMMMNSGNFLEENKSHPNSDPDDVMS